MTTSWEKHRVLKFLLMSKAVLLLFGADSSCAQQGCPENWLNSDDLFLEPTPGRVINTVLFINNIKIFFILKKFILAAINYLVVTKHINYLILNLNKNKLNALLNELIYELAIYTRPLNINR